MLKALIEIFQREITMIFNNKRIIIILFLVPLIFTFLFGAIYWEKNIKHLKLGVMNESESSISRTLINSFDKSESFDVVEYIDDKDDISYLMQKGIIDVVLIIPKDFTPNIKKGKNTTVFIGANGSNMTVSNTAMMKGVEIVGTMSAGISMKKYQAKGLLEEQAYSSAVPLSFQLRPLFNPTTNYNNFLLPGYIAVILQQVILYFAAITISDERKRNTIKELLLISQRPSPTIIGKFAAYFSCGFISLIVSFFIGVVCFAIPFRGSVLTFLLLSIAFLFCIISLGIFISIVAKNSLEATQYAMLVALPSFLLSGFTWPLETMPSFCKLLAHILPLTYYVTNMRDILLMGKDICFMQKDILILVSLGALFMCLAIYFYQRRFCSHSAVKSLGQHH